MIETNQLRKIKIKAKRAGVWFKALQQIDRVLIDLTINVTATICSQLLISRILSVVRKLECAIQCTFMKTVRDIGYRIAYRLVLLAESWGNINAKTWISDGSFATYLTVMKINGNKKQIMRY